MLVIDWERFVAGRTIMEDSRPLAITVGVFDGLHLGHLALIRRVLAEAGCIPTVVTFKENPARTLTPETFPGDIFGHERKMSLLADLGIELAVPIDFSGRFGMMEGRDFIDLLLGGPRTKLLVLGEDFRCGHRPGIGSDEIAVLAGRKGVETWVSPPVLDGGLPISSSRIRRALAEGRVEEAERLLGRRLETNVGGKT
ncbi:MAG: FAD synthetase family protein [Treponema sp.]|nr:FAD synthetase family protein [Treponema sp.]